VESQGDELWLALALTEIGIEYVEDTPENLQAWLLGRANALWEEDQ